MSDYILSFDNIIAGIDVHSYSQVSTERNFVVDELQLVLRPWGWGSKQVLAWYFRLTGYSQTITNN